MRTTGTGSAFRVLAGRVLAVLFVTGTLAATAAEVPRPVSPGARQPGAVAEARCPTFQWAGIANARGYELAVFLISAEVGTEPVLVTRATVPGDARGYTPPVGQCLERGQRYAWSVAATAGDSEDRRQLDGHLDWAPAFLFEVEAPPTSEELEQAVATIQRHLASRHDGATATRPGSAPSSELTMVSSSGGETARAPGSMRPPVDQRLELGTGLADAVADALDSPTAPLRLESAASTPTQSTASLSVSGQVHLAAASDFFKDDDVFLWDDTSGNTALGRAALASLSGTAAHNTAVGRGALQSTTAGTGAFYSSFNTAVGDLALNLNTTGNRNTALGAYALRSNDQGTGNTASGYRALRNNTSGSSNTAHGASTLRSNTGGYNNTATGYFALFSNTSGNNNTATGGDALLYNTTGVRNVASGFRALRANTTGSRNTATGSGALRYNTTGEQNTGTGTYTLFSNSDGARNTASGFSALRNNTSGFNNTASGWNALRSNITGAGNTASGVEALYSNTAGSFNTAIGRLALHDSTGARNIALGYEAGSNSTTGSDSIFIGNPGLAADVETIKIGLEGGQESTFIAGIRGKTTGVNDAIAVLIDSNGQLGTESSSREVKQDIQDLGSLANRLLDLRPVAFRYRQHAAADPETPLQFGLIAEEVAEVFPELVVYDDEGKPETVKYHLLSSLLLGELQKQQGELDDLRAKHQVDLERLAERQQVELRRLGDRLAALESRSPRADREAPTLGAGRRHPEPVSRPSAQVLTRRRSGALSRA